MCGLFASVGFQADPSRIDIVAHRGPDGRGWQEIETPSGILALGHRRLAIIDVSDNGLQPMFLGDRYALIFNGEIYNFMEIRAELEAQHEVFFSNTDTEVLLRSLAVWGEKALERLRGMFAFVFFDKAENKIMIVRDRFGIKPLYYTEGVDGLAIGSEIKQLLGLPSVSGRMNIDRVGDFLRSGVSDHTSETLFDGVKQLRPGELMVIDTSKGKPRLVRISRWYTLPRERISLTAEEASDRFAELLLDSIRLHLRSDVPVGSCLSGGLDSSSIVCLMADRLGSTRGGTQVQTVSACYEQKSVDEKPFMDAVVKHANTKPHFVWPKPDDLLQKTSDITWHQDEPFGSSSIFAQWSVFEEAKRNGIKVMLDGQGADEQLAGYTTGYRFHLAGQIRQWNLRGVIKQLTGRRRVSKISVYSQLVEIAPQFVPPSLMPILQQLRQSHTQSDWVGNGVLQRCGNRNLALDTAAKHAEVPYPQNVDDLCRVMTAASNLQKLLHWEDRNSMAHGVEARVPFLDHPLVEFSLALGNEHKIVEGKTKQVLRNAMKSYLPEVVSNRHDKLGFSTPESEWFRGTLRSSILDGIEDTLALYPELLNPAGVRSYAAEMLDGRRPVSFWLWRIVSLGIWGRRFGVSL